MHEPNPDDMLERMTSRHLAEWGVLFAIKAEEAESDRGGETPDFEVGPDGAIRELGEGEDEDDEDT